MSEGSRNPIDWTPLDNDPEYGAWLDGEIASAHKAMDEDPLLDMLVKAEDAGRQAAHVAVHDVGFHAGSLDIEMKSAMRRFEFDNDPAFFALDRDGEEQVHAMFRAAFWVTVGYRQQVRMKFGRGQA